jgi:hypothetical protein
MALNDQIARQAAQNAGLRLHVGARVYDQATGRAAVVVRGRIDETLVPAPAPASPAAPAEMFVLPERRAREVYIVELPDGQRVERGLGELTELPAGLRVNLGEFTP